MGLHLDEGGRKIEAEEAFASEEVGLGSWMGRKQTNAPPNASLAAGAPRPTAAQGRHGATRAVQGSRLVPGRLRYGSTNERP